jgi:hypothetical protein
VTGNTASEELRIHPDQARQRRQASEERTMRHALVPVQLIDQARTATASRALTDAPADEPKVRRARRRRRRAAVARRARPA